MYNDTTNKYVQYIVHLLLLSTHHIINHSLLFLLYYIYRYIYIL